MNRLVTSVTLLVKLLLLSIGAPLGTAFVPHTNHQRVSALTRHASQSTTAPTDTTKESKHVVIVGGGWAGFSAADALAYSSNTQDVKITLLDASPRGKGGLAGGWRRPQGRPVEAGIHGFWREYRNTFAVLEDRLGLDLNQVLTPFTPSVLYSKSGQVAVAPVLKPDDDDSSSSKEGTIPVLSPFVLADLLQSTLSPNKNSNSNSNKNLLKPLAAMLPTPLDLALLAKYNPASPLTVADRVSALGLLGAWADFGQEDEESWRRYDSISAEDLFLKKAGVSQQLYDEMVLPLLHVLPMCPGYDCSAAAALSCFHVFALQSQGAFDVRWCRGGIGELIFNPWAELLTASGVDIRGGCKVASIAHANDGNTAATTKGLQITLEDNSSEPFTCDAVVMAVGGTAMGRLAQASPAFDDIPIASDFTENRGVTCVAVRIFLKPHAITTSGLEGGQYDATQLPPDVGKAMKNSPVAVCGAEIGSIPELKETGFCIYDLQRLHDEFAVGKQIGDTPTAVLEVDFFRADDIADIEDNDKVAELALRVVAATLKTAPIPASEIVDLAVVRAKKAVSHFAINSASYSPPVCLLEKSGIYMCGDWVDRTGHASWSTEKAVVTGRQAAEQLIKNLELKSRAQPSIKVIPAAPDTPPLEALRRGAKLLRSVAPPPGDGVPQSPWSFLKSVVESRAQKR